MVATGLNFLNEVALVLAAHGFHGDEAVITGVEWCGFAGKGGSSLTKACGSPSPNKKLHIQESRNVTSELLSTNWNLFLILLHQARINFSLFSGTAERFFIGGANRATKVRDI